MTQHTNALGQPVGFPIASWQPPPFPTRDPMVGRTCTVRPLDAEKDSAALYSAWSLEPTGRNYTYLSYEPFRDEAGCRKALETFQAGRDPFFHTIVAHDTGKPVGVASLMRIDPPNGVIEVGHINYSPLLQSTTAATEAMYLMMARAFALGYRRYEWKCDTNNAPSKAAAARLGFQYEGHFRQAVVYKSRNRDTDWFSILDSEWPALKAAFETWLDPANFDGKGRQRQSLSTLTKAARAGMG